MRAAVYVRVSSEEQVAHGYSLEYQAESCRRRASELGAESIEFYRDEGVTGAILDRPGLTALRQAVRHHDVDLVVVFDPDRFARNVAHQLLVTEEIDRAGARLEFVNFEWRNTPEGQLFYAIRGAIAQYEKEKIRERTMSGRRQKARQGKMPHAHQPFGYGYDQESSTLVPHPQEAPVVQTIFTLFTESLWGYADIARWLDAQGIPTKKAVPSWHRNVVRQILMNPVYTGTFWANRYDCRDVSLNRFRNPAERRRPVIRDTSEWIAVPVTPLVNEETWRRAQTRIRAGCRSWNGRGRRTYILSGIAFCGTCGARMNGQLVQSSLQSYPYYACSSRHKDRPRIRADHLEEAVWEWVADWIRDPECFAQILKDSAASRWHGELVSRIGHEDQRLEERRAAACRAFAAGKLTELEWQEILERLACKAGALANKKASLIMTVNRYAFIQDPYRTLESILIELSPEQKRHLITTAIRGIYVYSRERVTIDARTSEEEVFSWRHRERDPDAPQNG